MKIVFFIKKLMSSPWDDAQCLSSNAWPGSGPGWCLSPCSALWSAESRPWPCWSRSCAPARCPTRSSSPPQSGSLPHVRTQTESPDYKHPGREVKWFCSHTNWLSKHICTYLQKWMSVNFELIREDMCGHTWILWTVRSKEGSLAPIKFCKNYIFDRLFKWTKETIPNQIEQMLPVMSSDVYNPFSFIWLFNNIWPPCEPSQ